MRKATNRLRQQIEGETLLTLEESRKLRAEHIELDRRRQETIDGLSVEVTSLKEALEQANSPSKLPALVATGRINNTLPPSQLALLEYLNSKGGSASEPKFIQDSSESKQKVLFDLGELARQQLLSRDFDQRSSDYGYSFTHEGRRALLNNGILGPETD